MLVWHAYKTTVVRVKVHCHMQGTHPTDSVVEGCASVSKCACYILIKVLARQFLDNNRIQKVWTLNRTVQSSITQTTHLNPLPTVKKQKQKLKEKVRADERSSIHIEYNSGNSCKVPLADGQRILPLRRA